MEINSSPKGKKILIIHFSHMKIDFSYIEGLSEMVWYQNRQKGRLLFDFKLQKDFKDFLCLEMETKNTVQNITHTKIFQDKKEYN